MSRQDETKAWSPSAAREAVRADIAEAVRQSDVFARKAWAADALQCLLDTPGVLDSRDALYAFLGQGDIDADDAPTLFFGFV